MTFKQATRLDPKKRKLRRVSLEKARNAKHERARRQRTRDRQSAEEVQRGS